MIFVVKLKKVKKSTTGKNLSLISLPKLSTSITYTLYNGYFRNVTLETLSI